MMRAIVPVGGVCSLVDRAIPALGVGQVLLRVAYSAVNRADTLQRRGLYPSPPGSTDILGLEAVGTVAGLGEGGGEGGPALGTRLMALLPGGGNAEYVAVLPAHCMAVPPRLTLREAAAIPETWLTAFQLLFLEGSSSSVGLAREGSGGSAPLAGALAGSVVVVHAAGSGVGTAAVQLAVAAGAHVVAVAGSEDKLAACAALGAAAGVNYKAGEPDSFAARLKAAVAGVGGGRGADLILDPVGASFAAANLEALAMDGTWVLYGSMGGLKLSSEAGAADALLGTILRKRARLLGTTLRNRSAEYKAGLVARFAAAVLPGFTTGAFKPIIFAELPLEDTGKAHELMESNSTLGKILLRVFGE